MLRGGGSHCHGYHLLRFLSPEIRPGWTRHASYNTHGPFLFIMLTGILYTTMPKRTDTQTRCTDTQTHRRAVQGNRLHFCESSGDTRNYQDSRLQCILIVSNKQKQQHSNSHIQLSCNYKVIISCEKSSYITNNCLLCTN